MTLGTPAAPTLETERLILRGWRPGDFEPYAAMLADGETFTAFRDPCDVWEMRREDWLRP